MIKNKRILLVFLVVCMLLSGFASCNQKKTVSSAPESAETADLKPITDSKEATEDEEEALKKLAIKYADKTIGVQTGTVFDAVINQYIPKADIGYYNSNADMALALKTGKISAYIADEPMARLLCGTYKDQYITGTFEKCPYAYIYPKDTEKTGIIRPQMNEFLQKIKSDGTIGEIDDIWFGSDESKKVVDTSDLTGENGILEFAMTSAVGAPFVYVKDNAYVGYDVDIAVRFCREYGYGIHITDSNVSGFFASIATGLADFGASSICITEERKEEMDFSDPNYEGSVVLVTKDFKETDVSEVSDVSEFDVLKGKTIGVLRETASIEYLEKTIPSCNIVELETVTDMAQALESGNIDAYLADQPLTRQVLSGYPNHHVLGVAEKLDYGFVFRKDNQKADKIRTQMNEFLTSIRENGTLEEIDSIWFGADESRKEIDFSGLSGENGTLKLAISSNIGEPFVYYRDGRVCGYETDIVCRFCKAYGYGLEITDVGLSEILNGVGSGEYDLAAACVTITEERQKLYHFSDPDYNGGTILVVKQTDEFDISVISDADAFDELKGKKIGYLAGSIFREAAEEVIDSPSMIAYSSSAEISKALESGAIDAYITDQPLARIQVRSYTDHHVHSVVARDEYAYAFGKDNRSYPQLPAQMNSFLKNLKADGTLDEIDDVWFGENTSLQTVDTSRLTGENGTLRMVVNSVGGAPFSYLKDGQYVGYDVDIAVRFCEEYGYGLQITDCESAQQALDGIVEGKYDLGASGFTVTEERKQVVEFSDPNYYGGIVIITKGTQEENEAGPTFVSSLINSFRKTFIREDRWKLFASGLGITVLITLLSAVFGSGLGFALFLLYRKKHRLINGILDRLSAFLQMTPVVVILMIFYYLILAKAGIPGEAVSVVAFSLMFACTVLDLFKAAVRAVDPGQMLAVRALGYRDTKGFLRMILPQTLPHFASGYKGAIIGLIKGTSIVSYVSVQDLTMVTDIVRSRTYEAFFPLLVTAAIYFCLAWLLVRLVGGIELRMDPKNRKESRILKGVQMK